MPQIPEEEERQYPLHPLSPELVLLMLYFLPPKDICNFALVSRECCIYANDDSLWRTLIDNYTMKEGVRAFVNLLLRRTTTATTQHSQRGRGAFLFSPKLLYFLLDVHGASEWTIDNKELQPGCHERDFIYG